ncbi:ABC transporter B family member 9 [Olea europaea subsp. europaea]|uniref:ABC transporter B family member 9 n=1 Tax=Olea europaea subsp. europaea TaxID=158383 RepID=A0A8S0PLN2_OLEEU|nr:ABC transporter B family member 9 [Olea europaea subsp. europaea]
MSKIRQGHNLIFIYFYAVSRKRCAGHVRDASGPRQGCNLIFKHFSTVSRTRCASHVPNVAETQPDVQAFLGHDVQAMSRTRQGWMEPDFQAFKDSLWARCAAMTGMHPDHGSFWEVVCNHARDVSGPW